MPEYTTQKLAKIFEVSGQTVRNAAKKLEIVATKEDEGKSFVFTQEQAEKIAEQLGKSLDDKPITDCGNSVIASTNEDALREIIELQKKQIEQQQEIIANNNAQIKDLMEQNKELIDIVQESTTSIKALSASNAMQVVTDKKDVLAIRTDAGEVQEKKKKGFLSRLFGM